MRLLEQFSFIDPNSTEWVAPAGSIVDGASIPQLAWSLIGGPFEGKYRNASVIHDVACGQKARPWELVHETFYFAMLASGVSIWKAKTMYAAVYHFGPRWPRTVDTSADSTKLADTLKEIGYAARGSDVTLSIKYRDDDVLGKEPRAQVHMVITPPKPTLTESDFAQLLMLIERRETSGSAISLEDIRKYAPPK